jgi:predicted RNase H-like HicB family nuclease
MERIVNIPIEKLPEGFYLATSDDIQGLVAQGRTINETIEIARDIIGKLLEFSSPIPQRYSVQINHI